MDNTRGLFRGKRTNDGEWVTGSYFPAPNVAIRGKLTHVIVTTNSLGTIMYYEIDPDTLGEYTGLTDKNGKMIFEGDICEAYGYLAGALHGAMPETCMTCRWHYKWFGVCTNGDSHWRGDCPPYPKDCGCMGWEARKENDNA